MSALHRFRRRNALALHELHYGPNMTPMVDVVMVILVFFMASAAILGPEWFLRSAVPVLKPSTSTGTSRDAITLRISLTRDVQATAARIGGPDEPAMSMDTLLERLASQAADGAPASLTVVVIPAGDVPYDDVVRVHEQCQKLGIVKVGILDDAGK